MVTRKSKTLIVLLKISEPVSICWLHRHVMWAMIKFYLLERLMLTGLERTSANNGSGDNHLFCFKHVIVSKENEYLYSACSIENVSLYTGVFLLANVNTYLVLSR